MRNIQANLHVSSKVNVGDILSEKLLPELIGIISHRLLLILYYTDTRWSGRHKWRIDPNKVRMLRDIAHLSLPYFSSFTRPLLTEQFFSIPMVPLHLIARDHSLIHCSCQSCPRVHILRPNTNHECSLPLHLNHLNHFIRSINQIQLNAHVSNPTQHNPQNVIRLLNLT